MANEVYNADIMSEIIAEKVGRDIRAAAKGLIMAELEKFVDEKLEGIAVSSVEHWLNTAKNIDEVFVKVKVEQ